MVRRMVCLCAAGCSDIHNPGPGGRTGSAGTAGGNAPYGGATGKAPVTVSQGEHAGSSQPNQK